MLNVALAQIPDVEIDGLFWVLFSIKLAVYIWLLGKLLFYGVPRPAIVHVLHIFALQCAILASLANWLRVGAVCDCITLTYPYTHTHAYP